MAAQTSRPPEVSKLKPQCVLRMESASPCSGTFRVRGFHHLPCRSVTQSHYNLFPICFKAAYFCTKYVADASSLCLRFLLDSDWPTRGRFSHQSEMVLDTGTWVANRMQGAGCHFLLIESSSAGPCKQQIDMQIMRVQNVTCKNQKGGSSPPTGGVLKHHQDHSCAGAPAVRCNSSNFKQRQSVFKLR